LAPDRSRLPTRFPHTASPRIRRAAYRAPAARLPPSRRFLYELLQALAADTASCEPR
jgi:hypothetical protein